MNIDKLIRDAAQKQDPNDRPGLTNTVLAQIPKDKRIDVLKGLIQDRITLALGSARNQAIRDMKEGTTGTEPTIPVQGGHTFVDIDSPAPPIKVNSSKRDRIREAFFSQIIPVEDGKLKKLGDLTEADLRHVAQVREKMAESNLSQAQAYKALADLLRDKKLSKLSEAPLDEVKDTLNGK